MPDDLICDICGKPIGETEGSRTAEDGNIVAHLACIVDKPPWENEDYDWADNDTD